MRIGSRLQALRRRVSSSAFIKSVFTLSSGNAVRMAINVAGMPVVGRLYTPAAMGDYELIIAHAGVISSVACLGMMTVFMLPPKDEEARALSRLVTYSCLIITTAAVLALWFCSGVYQMFHTEETPYYLSLAVLWLYILSTTVSNICYAYVNRRRLYNVLFWNPVISALFQMGTAIVFGFLGWGFLGYTLSHILSELAAILHLIHYANPYEAIQSHAFSPLSLLKSYRRFPLYQMPANLVATLAQRLPAQMLGKLYSASALGMYSMAIRVLAIPSNLLSVSVNRVYFREASERFNRGEDVGAFSFRILEANMRIAILPISILIVFGEELFALFLGEQWRQAGTFAALLGMYYLLAFCKNCLSGCYVLIQKNQNYLYISLAYLLCSLILYFLVLFFRPDVLLCVAFLTLFNALEALLSLGYFFYLAGFSMRKYCAFLLLYIVLPAALCWALRQLIHGI